MLPEPPMPLPPPNDTYPEPVGTIPSSQMTSEPVETVPSSQMTSESAQDHVPPSRHNDYITHTNSFHLFRVYDSDTIPVHDPEDRSDHDNPGDSPLSRPTVNVVQGFDPENQFHPYPNENSWRLGDWYWNQGTQKSKKSFRTLLDIIGSTNFHPEDVSSTNWATIDRELGGPGTLERQSSVEWMEDEWEHRNITISVPFSRRCENPGPKDYTISEFYRRSLISIIREQLTDPIRCSRFHFEPYSLRWKPPHKTRSIDVHGELYTSTTFIEAHRKLQDSPPEADCDLPRRIVALMFWSDATHLTSFGEAKLWPLYVYFGNDSKYERAQPTSHLCTHVAYFRTVSNSVNCHYVNS